MVRENSGDGCAHIPVRTCVGCRERAPKQELLRVVARVVPPGFTVVVDAGARASGRGAYLHPTPECYELASRRRAFGRALRVQGALDESPLTEHLQLARQN